MTVQSHAKLAQLTSLRFFAALLVLLSHLVFFEQSRSPALRGLYEVFLRQGACGVTFFFILSGFILTHAYERALKTGEVSVATYLYRRLARIFPLHLAVGLAFIGYLVLKNDLPPTPAIWLNLALLHSWFPEPLIHYSLNGPSWTLSNELFFYTLFPWLVKMSPKTMRSVFIGGIAVIAAGASFAAMRVHGYSPFVDWLFYVFPLTRLFEFLAGILLYRAWQQGMGRRWATGPTEALLVATVLATMFAVDWFSVPLAFRYQLVFVPPMAALILIFAHGRGALSGMLHNPVLQLLGEASFALYLVHRPLMTFMERWASGTAAGDLALASAMLLLALTAAILTYLLFDRPVERWLRRRSKSAVGRDPLAAQ
ncbi:acyltransferase [Novosphingobium sp. PhB165]|uniref:acyltransferase family protein n=1 Tax=Novosphingobium sp. PhB165 TaxID=2485105 RepID=UPI0014044C7E|nr:acyltransferase [Novosphingobium sp. PhB165]